jgi:hypothetical protein
MNEATARRHSLRRRLMMVVISGAMALVTVASPAFAASPINDDISNAIIVGDTPYTDTVDTSEATVGEGDSGCGAATVWYAFTPSEDGVYQFNTFGSDYDTTLALFEGSPGNLTLLACSDDTENSLQSLIAHALVGGATYFVEAGACCDSPGSNLVVNIDVAPPPFQVALALDGVRVGRELGSAIVSGSATCSGEGGGELSGTLVQKQGLFVVRGEFFAGFRCTDRPTTWTATVSGGSRVFLPKPATVSLNGLGCDLFSCDDSSVVQRVKITRK